MVKKYLLAYDIADKKRLVKVRKVAYAYALGGQKSMLETPMNDKTLKELVRRLEKLMRDNDKVNIIEYSGEPLCFGKANYIDYEKGIIIL